MNRKPQHQYSENIALNYHLLVSLGIIKNFFRYGSSVLVVCLFITGNGVTQERQNRSPSNKTFHHAVNSCPGGIFFGIYSINYEYLLGKYHGIVGRLDYEHIPKTYTDANIDASGLAYILNYRWHFSGKMESYYAGVFTWYRVYNGTGTLASTSFDFTLRDHTLGLNAGKRWIWDCGINLNMAFGYGYSLIENQKTEPSNDSIKKAIDDFKDAYDFINPFYGEISVGYAF